MLYMSFHACKILYYMCGFVMQEYVCTFLLTWYCYVITVAINLYSYCVKIHVHGKKSNYEFQKLIRNTLPFLHAMDFIDCQQHHRLSPFLVPDQRCPGLLLDCLWGGEDDGAIIFLNSYQVVIFNIAIILLYIM